VAANRWTRRGAASSRSALAALALVGGFALAGCGAGQQAQTAEQRPTVDGANVNLYPLAIRDVGLEYPPDGVYEKGSDARLQMVVINQGTSSDALVEVRTDAAEKVTITAAGEDATPTTAAAAPPSESGTPTTGNPSPSVTGGYEEPSGGASATATAAPAPSATPGEAAATRIPIPANGLVSFRGDGPTVLLTGLTERLRASQVIRVALVFQNAGEVELDIAVSVPEGEISAAPTVAGHEEE
jgi:copper(I)-binding protein